MKNMMDMTGKDTVMYRSMVNMLMENKDMHKMMSDKTWQDTI